MLRDALVRLPGIATWPCDEINYIWRHGNVRFPSDEFIPAMATPRIATYIRSRFDWVSRYYAAPYVLEKTCANSLRVGFVDRVVPDARYVFIRRDGFDVVGSAVERWQAKLDIPYLARKARFVPLTDLPYYASRYAWNRVYRLISGRRRLSFWGPQLHDLQQLLARHTLEEICAIQWSRCVESSLAAAADIAADRWTEVSYEDLVGQPAQTLARVVSRLGITADNHAITAATRDFSSSSVGKGRSELGARVEAIRPLIARTMHRLGYG